MGFFSWETSDTNESIRNSFTEEGATPCKMLFPDGTVIECDDYEGYGTFSGVDFYEAVDKLNGGDGDRDNGIRLMDVNSNLAAPVGVIAPRFVSMDYEGDWASVPDSKQCDEQGYFNWGSE
jgi:hypothetical protein